MLSMFTFLYVIIGSLEELKATTSGKSRIYKLLDFPIVLSEMDFGTWPMITDSDKFFPVESESGLGSKELALVFEKNRVKCPKKRVFGHFWGRV